jgi:hypothetical protein
MLEQKLLQYINDTENADVNFNLALEYKRIGQTASAISFFLRCADRSKDDLDLAYECLIHMGECFDIQQNRSNTVTGLYKHAISILPKRPEAYYKLANFQNWHTQYQDATYLCNTALDVCDFNCKPFREPCKYPGKWGLIYEKTVSLWWWGKSSECRRGYRLLVDEYWDQLDNYHKKMVEDKFCKLGSSPKSQTFTYYDSSKYSQLRYKFPGSENIQRNYSQIYQDMFTLSVLNGKRNGTFLEIGGATPYDGNNTALLEKDFGWTGVSIEYQQKFVDEYKNARPTKVYCLDALQTDYDKFIAENFESNVIDYLQLDIEPARNTYALLLEIPFDKYKFAVITYEHDHYVDVTKQCRQKSREYLKSKGYVLVVSDLSPDGESNFEDWWVHPDLVDPNILNIMKDDSDTIKKAETFMLSSVRYQHSIPKESNIEFKINTSTSNTVWVVDNFYEDPYSVREFALNQDYHIGGIGRGYIGNRTYQQFLFPELKEKFEKIMGRKITGWEEYDMNGRFQYCWSGQPLVYHCDNQKWGGVLYLTPDAPYQCGTTLYAHKKTRARTYYDQGWDASWGHDIPGDPHLDGTPFEPVDFCGNVFNRLFIFDASCIHSASEYFGTVKENCRLWQMFFFDTE